MFYRSFVSILIVTSSFILAIGQKPEARKELEKAPQTFAFSFAGDGGYLGVQTQEINKDNFSKFGLRDVRGVAVEKVLENSPAAAAGIKDGDVIVRFNGEEITSSRKLTRLVGEVDPDHQVKLTVVRNGSEQEITATVGKRPAAGFGNGNFSFSMPEPPNNFDIERLKDLPQIKDFPELKDFPKSEGFKAFTFPDGDGKVLTWFSGNGRQIGVGVTSLTRQLAQHFGVESGVMINDVRENSAASKAGLRAGDIIVEADGKVLKGDFDLMRAVNGKKEGDVQLTIVREGKRQTISVTPEPSKGGGYFFKTGDGDGLELAPGRIMIPQAPIAPMIAPSPRAPLMALRPYRIV